LTATREVGDGPTISARTCDACTAPAALRPQPDKQSGGCGRPGAISLRAGAAKQGVLPARHAHGQLALPDHSEPLAG